MSKQWSTLLHPFNAIDGQSCNSSLPSVEHVSVPASTLDASFTVPSFVATCLSSCMHHVINWSSINLVSINQQWAPTLCLVHYHLLLCWDSFNIYRWVQLCFIQFLFIWAFQIFESSGNGSDPRSEPMHKCSLINNAWGMGLCSIPFASDSLSWGSFNICK